MKKTLQVIRILFEVVGGLAILLCGYLYYAFRGTVQTSARRCSYAQALDVTSPDGKMIAERRLETCPEGVWVQVYLKSVDDVDVPDTKVMSLGKMDTRQVGLLWTSPKDLQVTLPANAPLIHADGFVEDVTITRKLADQ